MQNVIKIHGGNLELLSQADFTLSNLRGMESPGLDRVNTYREAADNFRKIIFHYWRSHII